MMTTWLNGQVDGLDFLCTNYDLPNYTDTIELHNAKDFQDDEEGIAALDAMMLGIRTSMKNQKDAGSGQCFKNA